MKNSKKQRESKRKSYRDLLVANRKAFHLVPDDELDWVLKNDKGAIIFTLATGENKKQFITACRNQVRALCEEMNQLGQLVVHSKDGRIEFEATYGNDPKRSKG